MAKKGEKTLTRNQVKKLGLNGVSVITADMFEGYTSIGDSAFWYCSHLTSITIPNSVTSIGKYAFCNCTGLISVTIPNSVTSIGEWAFYGCTNLRSIDIPNSITSIGRHAFQYCSGLTTVKISNNIKSIKDYVFSDCKSLSSIEIPNGITSIGDSAFFGCHGLTFISIEDKIYKNKVIKDRKCKAYKAFNADMTCRDFKYEEGKTYKFKGEPKLCKYGFHACLNLTDVFTYYFGKLGKDIVVHEVELEDVSDERYYDDSKVVAKKITIGKRIL